MEKVSSNLDRINRVKQDDPRVISLQTKFGASQRLADLIRETTRDIENQVTLVVSIFMSAVVGALLAVGKLTLAIALFDIMLVALYIIIKKQNKDLTKLWANYNPIARELHSQGFKTIED